MKLVFEDLIGDNSVEYFLYCIYFECIFTRNLASIQYKKVKSYLYKAFYLYHIEVECKKSILAAIAAVPKYKKAHIKQK